MSDFTREIDLEEMRIEARLAREAYRMKCEACGLRGCHRPGCPEEPEQELTEEE